MIIIVFGREINRWRRRTRSSEKTELNAERSNQLIASRSLMDSWNAVIFAEQAKNMLADNIGWSPWRFHVIQFYMIVFTKLTFCIFKFFLSDFFFASIASSICKRANLDFVVFWERTVLVSQDDLAYYYIHFWYYSRILIVTCGYFHLINIINDDTQW